jgi:perosamine synthetase
VAQLERADRILAERSRVASHYRERLEQLDAVRLPSEGDGLERRSWFVYVVEVADGIDRDAVIDRLAERGIASKAYLPCIHLQPYYRERFGFKGGEFPVAERVASQALALPFFTSLTEEHVERICDALAEIVGAPPP